MSRTKKDPNLATVTYNAQNVERAIGYTIALVDHCEKYQDSLNAVTTKFDLSPIESAMVQMGTSDFTNPNNW